MREYKRVIFEALTIAIVGIGIALIANAQNPDGLLLGKNHFAFQHGPTATHPSTASAPQGSQPTTRDSADSGAAEIKAILQPYGLATTDSAEAARLFRDPGYLHNLYLFLDARNEDDYIAGHIPGAFHLYAFLKDESLRQQFYNEFIPLAAGAEKVIVYCDGGHCDDSVQVAIELPQQGLDPAKIGVDVDGFEAWKKAGLPVERGVRGSGDIIEGKK